MTEDVGKGRAGAKSRRGRAGDAAPRTRPAPKPVDPLVALQAEFDALGNERDVLTRALAEAREEARLASARLVQLRAEADDLAAARGREGHALRERLASAESALDEAHATAARLDTDLARERELRAEMRRQTSSAFDRLAEAEHAWVEAAAALAALRRAQAELSIRALGNEAEAQRLAAERDRLTAEIEPIRRRAAEAEARAAEAEARAAEAEARAAKLAAAEARAVSAERERAAIAAQLEAAAFALRERVELAVSGIARREAADPTPPQPTAPRPAAPAPPDPSPALTPLHAVPDLLPLMIVGQRGEREGRAVKVLEGEEGHAFFGPFRTLRPGRYVLEFCIEVHDSSWWPSRKRVCVVEAISGETYFAQRELAAADLKAGKVGLPFEIAEAHAEKKVEFRLWTSGLKRLTVSRLQLEATS